MLNRNVYGHKRGAPRLDVFRISDRILYRSSGSWSILKFYILYKNSRFRVIRAIASVYEYSCKIQKGAHFTHFDKKKPTSVGVKLCINAQVPQ